MRGLILAAGRGSRLKGLGDDRPKCLIELAGMTLLDRQIAALHAGGVHEIGIVRGYRADMLTRSDLVAFENSRWAETNMVTSLAAAEPWLKIVPVIASYADIFYSHRVVSALARAPGPLVITYDRNWYSLWNRRFADPLSDAETFRVDASGKLLEIGAKTDRIEAIEGQYMGLFKVTPNAWQTIAQLLARLDSLTRDRLDMTGLLGLLVGAGYPIATVAAEGGWGEIDHPDDLVLYCNMLDGGELRLEA